MLLPHTRNKKHTLNLIFFIFRQASSSCDGSVKVWDVKTGDVIKTLPDVFPRCNDFFRALILGRPSWQSQNGGFLAVPTGKEVTLYVRDSWIAAVRLSDSKVMSVSAINLNIYLFFVSCLTTFLSFILRWFFFFASSRFRLLSFHHVAITWLPVRPPVR